MKDRLFTEFCHTVETKLACVSGKNPSFYKASKYPFLPNVLVMDHREKSLDLSTCNKNCPTLCDPMNCSPPGSSVHGILQARIQEWVAISFFRGSSQTRDRTHVSCIAGGFLSTEPQVCFSILIF